MSKHVMECVDLDDGGSRCRQFVHGNLTETPPGECPTPYKSPKQLLDEALAQVAALREELQTRTADLLECGTRRKAAEQRSAHLEWLLDKVINGGDYPVKVLHEQIANTLKPTDSGESERGHGIPGTSFQRLNQLANEDE